MSISNFNWYTFFSQRNEGTKMGSVCTYFSSKLYFMCSETISSLNNFKQIINENREFDELISQLFIACIEQKRRSDQQHRQLIMSPSPMSPFQKAAIEKAVRIYGPVTGKIHCIQKLFRRCVDALEICYRTVCAYPKKKLVIGGLGIFTIIATTKAFSAIPGTELLALVSQWLNSLIAVLCLDVLHAFVILVVFRSNSLTFMKARLVCAVAVRFPGEGLPFWDAMCEKVKENTQVYFNHLLRKERINKQLKDHFSRDTAGIIKSFLPAVSLDCDVQFLTHFKRLYAGGLQRDIISRRRQFIINIFFNLAKFAAVIKS